MQTGKTFGVLPLIIASVFFTALALALAGGTRGTVPPRLTAAEARVKNLLSLSTVEHRYRDIVYIGADTSFLFIRTSTKRVLFSIDIVVRAGIDLSKGFELIRFGGSRGNVLVRLPPAEILSTDADESSIRQYFVKEQGAGIGLLEVGDEIGALKARLRDDAVRRGILVRAEDGAKRMIEDLLLVLGFESVSFEATEPRNDLSDGEAAG